MKAIIMAGGEGSRLRPLTCDRPKPLVPVLNKPVMAHIIELLQKCSINNIGVTLQYQPEAIREHFSNGAEYGVNLHYFIEDTPLGTAGSVKNAAGFLDETFLVISGDALTDLDLTQAIDFHRKNGALATLVLTRVACPLEYGVVITGDNGSISRFLEKPSWGEVFSDTVNTGIYVLEPEVLDYFTYGHKFDFSKDLFPLLLKKQKPLFGLVLNGYWCDIGNLTQYLQAHHEALSGRVKISIPGVEIAPGIWVEEGALIDPSAKINGPVLIGANCRVEAEAQIDPLTVLGKGCLIQKQASVKRSVLWNNVFVGTGAALRGAVVGHRVQIQAQAGIYEGAVVGDDSVIMENSQLKPDIKLWPHKLVEAGTILRQSVVWGTRAAKNLFGSEGISGYINSEITSENAVRIGAAFGTVCGVGTPLILSADNHNASLMIKDALSSGLQSVGAAVLDIGTGITPMHRFGVRSLDCLGGMHVKVSALNPDKLVLVFTDRRGGNISRGLERKIENTLAREDFPRVSAASIISPAVVPGLAADYLDALCGGLNRSIMRDVGLKLALGHIPTNLHFFVQGICNRLGITLLSGTIHENTEEYDDWRFDRDNLAGLTRTLAENRADIGALLDANADRLILTDDTGRMVQEDQLIALISLIILKEQSGSVVVPVTASQAIDTLAERYQSKVVRTRFALQDFMDKVLSDVDGDADISHFFLHFDALAALVRILSFMAVRQITLTELLKEIPAIHTDKKEIPVSWESKGKVIRYLIQDPPAGRIELLDGVKVYHSDGWALVLPDPDEPLCRIFSEGTTMEIAESLTDFYVNRISAIVGQEN